MARNEEKQLGRLNRFYLQKDKEENLKKNPPRPRLETLKNTADVQKWIPSIKRDIDFCIKQSMVPCYPKSTIQEFSSRIDRLQGEYKAFLRRLRELDPDMRDTPWTERPYTGHKRTAADHKLKDSAKQEELKDQETKKVKTTFRPLAAPILEQDVNYKSVYGYVEVPPIINNVDLEKQDEPLDFRVSSSDSDLQCKKPYDFDVHRGYMDRSDGQSEDVSGNKSQCLHDKRTCVQTSCVSSSERIEPCVSSSERIEPCVSLSETIEQCVSSSETIETCVSPTQPTVSHQKSPSKSHVLNLPYSDSDSDS